MSLPDHALAAREEHEKTQTTLRMEAMVQTLDEMALDQPARKPEALAARAVRQAWSEIVAEDPSVPRDVARRRLLERLKSERERATAERVAG